MTDFLAEWQRDNKVVRRCACRGAPIAVEGSPTPQAIHAAVVEHQETTLHARWNREGGMQGELDSVGQGTFEVIVSGSGYRPPPLVRLRRAG